MERDGVFVVTQQVCAPAEIPWEHIKRNLGQRAFDELFSLTIGDGLHHVIKSDYMKDECFDKTIYYLKIRHSIARVQSVNIQEFISIPETAVRICTYCGSVMNLDKRGCCATCGAPPYKWEMIDG